MSEQLYGTIEGLLTSSKPEDILRGLEMVRHEFPAADPHGASSLFEMVTALFYIDQLDRPDLAPVLDAAVNVVVSLGAPVIPLLLETLDAGDLKAQMAVSQALGRVGVDAIQPLLAEYRSTDDPEHRAFVLYALGKIKSPKIVEAAHLTLEAAQSEDMELRDTATRAIGKLVESIPPSALPQEIQEAYVDILRKNLADTSPAIRAKAVRSFGKLAKYGHLNAAELEQLRALCRLILGTDDNFDWDRAYIVRREAKEALQYA